jgi:hypothetical protein
LYEFYVLNVVRLGLPGCCRVGVAGWWKVLLPLVAPAPDVGIVKQRYNYCAHCDEDDGK